MASSFKAYLDKLKTSGYEGITREQFESTLMDGLQSEHITKTEYNAYLASYDEAQLAENNIIPAPTKTATTTTTDTKTDTEGDVLIKYTAPAESSPPNTMTAVIDSLEVGGWQGLTEAEVLKLLKDALNAGAITNAEYQAYLESYYATLKPVYVEDPKETAGEITSGETTTTSSVITVIDTLQANNWQGLTQAEIIKLLKDAYTSGAITEAQYQAYVQEYYSSLAPTTTETAPPPADPADPGESDVVVSENTIILDPLPLGHPMSTPYLILQTWLNNGWDGATPGAVYDLLNRLRDAGVITEAQYTEITRNFVVAFQANVTESAQFFNQLVQDAMNHGLQNYTRQELSDKLNELISFNVLDGTNAGAILDAWDDVNAWANQKLGSGINLSPVLIAVFSAIVSYTIYNYPKLLPSVVEMVRSVFWILVFGISGGLVLFTGYKLYSNYKGNFGYAIAQTVKDMLDVVKDFVVELITELMPMLLSLVASIAGEGVLDNVAGILDMAIGIGNTIADEITLEEHTKLIVTACYLYMENFPVTPTMSEIEDEANQTLALVEDNTSDTPVGDFFDRYI